MASDEELLNEIQRLASDGDPPTAQEMRDDGQFGTGQFKRHFGSWNNAIKEAEFTVNHVRTVSGEELLDEIQRLASDGVPPTTQEMQDDGQFDPGQFKRHFGSWNNAIREAEFTVNRVRRYGEKQVLQAIQKSGDGHQAPAPEKFNKDTSTSTTHDSVHENIGSWWKGVVRAGLVPQRRFPLTANQFCEFHEATVSQDKPEKLLAGLFLLFTGLPAELISEVSRSWFDYLSDDRYGTTLTVPNSHLHSAATGEWTFKLPANYTIGGETKGTQLPGLAKWFFTQSSWSGRTLYKKPAIQKLTHRIARDAEISRRSVNLVRVGECPEVTPTDLRASAGVQMARNGAPARRIRQHLGIEHTNWKADVEDFFLWLYVHEGYEHPDYDPPEVVLDSVLSTDSP